MGLFDFFSRRRQRESAIPEAEIQSQDQPVVGQQVEGAQQLPGGIDLSQLRPMIQSAIAQGNVTVEQGPAQTIDMRGSGLREEIVGIMKSHGIDAEAGDAQASIDAGDYGDMQKQILEALSKRGLNLGDGGVQIQPPEHER
jgi:hypothetical protein